MSEFTVDYFIAKFEGIPDRQWTRSQYTDGWGGFCALGHCGEHVETSTDGSMRRRNVQTEEAEALRKLFSDSLGIYCSPDRVNDGMAEEYQQENPKQRILAALRDIKAAQEPSN
jgi:hypothetical protein